MQLSQLAIHFFPEQEVAPHRPDELLLFEAEFEDHFEQCEGYEKNKLNALLCHQSQLESTMGIGPGSIDADTATLRATNYLNWSQPCGGGIFVS